MARLPRLATVEGDRGAARRTLLAARTALCVAEVRWFGPLQARPSLTEPAAIRAGLPPTADAPRAGSEPTANGEVHP